MERYDEPEREMSHTRQFSSHPTLFLSRRGRGDGGGKGAHVKYASAAVLQAGRQRKARRTDDGEGNEGISRRKISPTRGQLLKAR